MSVRVFSPGEPVLCRVTYLVPGNLLFQVTKHDEKIIELRLRRLLRLVGLGLLSLCLQRWLAHPWPPCSSAVKCQPYLLGFGAILVGSLMGIFEFLLELLVGVFSFLDPLALLCHGLLVLAAQRLKLLRLTLIRLCPRRVSSLPLEVVRSKNTTNLHQINL